VKPNHYRSGRITAVLSLLIVLALPSIMGRSGMKAATCVVNPVVTNNADSGAGSLRQAILDACDGSTITFANSAASPITLAGELAIDKNLTIQGPGANALTISGNHAVRVFNIGSVNPVVKVTLSGLTIAEGRGNGEGGGIFDNSLGTLTVSDCTISGNSASDGYGGGILNVYNGQVTIENSTISGNISSVGCGINNFGGGLMTVKNSIIANNTALGSIGGGIYNDGTLAVFNCTISDNSTAGGDNGEGGGIFNDSFGTASVTNSTISGNTTSFCGGGISNNGGAVTVIGSTFSGNGGEFVFGGGLCNSGTANITNCTFSGNQTSSGSGSGMYNFFGTVSINDSTFAANGSGIVRQAGTVMLKNTIVALNNPDLYFAFTSLGHNLIGNADGSTGFTDGVNGDQVGSSGSPVNPRLAPLGKNGGPTLTMALLPGSPAIDAGDDSVLGPTLFLTTDQRGAGFARRFGAHVDIGAFEVQVQVDACLKDDSSGDVFQLNSMTGQYQFTRCSDGFMLSGTGVVSLADGIMTLTDSERHLRVNAELDIAQRTGSAVIRIKGAPGGRQTFRINSTNPAAVCGC
jgi:hypothetical protein